MSKIVSMIGFFAICLPWPANCDAQQVLFRDDFDAELDSRWITSVNNSYTSEIEDGRFKWTPTTSLSKNAFVADLPTDISIRARARLAGQPSGEVFVGIGGRDVLNFPQPDTGNYYAGITTGGRIGIGISAGPVLMESTTTLDIVNHDIDFRFDLSGNELRFWAWESESAMPVDPQLVATDDTISEGDYVLLSYSTGSTALPLPAIEWDFFEVTQIPEPTSGLLSTGWAVVLIWRNRRRYSYFDVNSKTRNN